MNDEFLVQFDWIKDVLKNDIIVFFKTDSIEYEILTQFKNEWGNRNTLELLKDLTSKYGDKAGSAVEEFLKMNIMRDWPEVGKATAHMGTEIPDFIQILWKPLKDKGFAFTFNNDVNIFTFNVSKCPIYDLAEKTGMHEWLYHMACSSDFYTTPSFSKEIGFTRTKSLMQGDECCDHTYYYRSKIKTEDSLLGYCGLYCGACPNYQKTDTIKPVDFKKENFYEPCEGCNSIIKTEWCSKCDIAECNKNRNIRVCYDCKEFPCEKMKKFMNDEKYPYHKEVPEKMMMLKKIKLERWLEAQEKRYKCNNCGNIYNFFQKTCSKCGENL